MPCCGNARAASQPGPSHSHPHPAPAETFFEYTGAGQLTVTGSATGIVYRFTEGSAPVRVHPADAPSLASVRGLRATR